MGREVIIEVRRPDGSLRERHRMHTFPIRVGRAYSNDLIIDDRHVCPEHLIVDAEPGGSGLVVRDLDSLNGIRVAGSSRRVNETKFNGRAEFRIGATLLSIIDASQPVPPAVPLRQSAIFELDRPDTLRWWHAVMLLLLFGGIDFIDDFALGERTGDNQMLQWLLGTLSACLLLLIWSGLWALASRSGVKRFRLAHHLSIAAAAVIVQTIFGRLIALGEFALALPRAGSTIRVLTWTAIGVVLLAGHLRFSTRLRRRGRYLVSAGVVGALTMISLLYVYASGKDFSTKLPLSVNIQPPWVRLVAGVSPGELAERMAEQALTLEP